MFNDIIFTIYRQKNSFQMHYFLYLKMKEQNLELKAGKTEVSIIHVVQKKRKKKLNLPNQERNSNSHY
jgi:hypothetical protein